MTVNVPMKGLHRVKAKGQTYHYAWRGGPRLRGEFGSPEFHASYNEAIAERHAPDPGRFNAVVVRYKGSNDYKRLAETTRKQWGRWLDGIRDHFGELRTAQFDRPQKIRKVIRQWRNKFADTPRTADYGMQVLSRVCAFAVEDGDLASNPCEGISQLYSNDRSEIIWTDADIAQLKKTGGSKTVKGNRIELPCPAEVAHAVDLASYTGLRLSDLLRVSWSHVGEDSIVLPTGKSRGRREAIIPLYDELRNVLACIPKRATTILSNSQARPWTVNGFQTAMQRAKDHAKMRDANLHFHDLRGTAATKFYIAGISTRVIAEMLAWSEDEVERIIRRYVGRAAATKEAIRQLNAARRPRDD